MWTQGAGEIISGWWALTKILAVFALLGVWKAIELIIWAFSHLSITIN